MGDHPVAELRRKMGLSQSELAVSCGLSRPLISAVETGRHAPSVSAAIAIAKTLGTTVSELFAAPRTDEEQVPALGRLPASPGPVAAVRIDGMLVYHPVGRDDATEAAWARGDGWYENGSVALYEDADVSGLVAAGCDPAIGLASSMLPARGPQRLVAIPSCNRRSLEALEAGRVPIAVVHGQDSPVPRGRKQVARIVLASWRIGLASRAPFPDLRRLAEGSLVLAHEGRGAEWQEALERALEPYGGTGKVVGPVAGGMVDAVRYVVHGSCDLALTMEAAARQWGLPFLPLEEHRVELRILCDFADHPGVTGLLEVIASRPFRERLEAVGGYDLSQAGQAL